MKVVLRPSLGVPVVTVLALAALAGARELALLLIGDDASGRIRGPIEIVSNELLVVIGIFLLLYFIYVRYIKRACLVLDDQGVLINFGSLFVRVTGQRRIPWVDIVDIDIRPWRLLSKIRIVLRNDSIEARHRARELASYKVTGGRGVKDNEMVFFDFAVTEGAATTIRRLMERSLHRGTEE